MSPFALPLLEVVMLLEEGASGLPWIWVRKGFFSSMSNKARSVGDRAECRSCIILERSWGSPPCPFKGD